MFRGNRVGAAAKIGRGCLVVAGAALAFFVLLAVLMALSGPRDTVSVATIPAAPPPQQASPTLPPPPPLPTPSIEPERVPDGPPLIPDGMLEVGTDIAPGVYRVGQYWELQDKHQNTLANDLTQGCPSIVVVTDRHAFLKVQGGAVDATVTRVDPIAEECTSGTFLVGTDIEPGKYKLHPLGGHGYWERINSRLGTIANDLSAGQSIVVVRASDFALKINGGSLERM